MQLVDVVEPDALVCEPAFGIDLGTTHSLVAIAEDGGKVRVFRDLQGNFLIPSVVEYCSSGSIKVGHMADDSCAIRSIKRIMGKSVTEVKEEFYGYCVQEDGNNVALEIGRYGRVSPAEVSSEILKHLSFIVRNSTGEEIKRAVITVPAYFDEVARKATRDAAHFAGIEVIRLLNEPTAAALVYEQIAEGEMCLVYDLGGGTFDVSVVKMHNGVLQVIATGGDTNLGGDDIDCLLGKLVLEKYGEINGTRISDVAWGLRIDAKKAKEVVSSSGYDGVHNFRIGDENFAYRIDEKEFSHIVNGVVAKTINIVLQTMLDANITSDDIARVILVGGSSKIPHVKLSLSEIFGNKVCDDIDPEKAVVTGAALQAYYLTNPSAAVSKGKVLMDVVPLSLSLETIGGIAEVIIPRNTPVPALVTQVFTTYIDGQTMISIHVCQGEREIASENRTLAIFDIRVPPLPAGEVRIQVEFRVDMDGLLTVSVCDGLTGAVKSVEISSMSHVTLSDIEKQVVDSVANFDSDMIAKESNAVYAECMRVLEVVKDILRDGDWLSEADRNSASDILTRSGVVLSERNVESMRAFISAVSQQIIDWNEKKSSILCQK